MKFLQKSLALGLAAAFISLLFAFQVAIASVAADSANAYLTNSAFASSTTWTTSTSATVASGDNLLMVVVWTNMNGVGSTTHYSSCAWNGASMTYVGQLMTTFVYDVEYWELVSPTAGTGTISCTWPASLATNTFRVVAVPFSGVNTTTPLGTLATNNSGTSTGTVTATGGVAGDLYFGFVGFNGGGTTITSTGTGQVSVKSEATGTADQTLSADTIPGNDAGAFSWTNNGSTTQAYALAVDIKAASGGGSCTHDGITSAGALVVPNGTSGSYQGKSGAFVTPDCSTVNYKQPTVGNFGVN